MSVIAKEELVASKARSYPDVDLVQRTLAIIECANKLDIITISEISRRCAIPASSVVRIVETLCSEGYLMQISRRGGYVLTSKVRALSSGFHGKDPVVEVLKPIADKLTKQFLWPFAVATLERNCMVVQYSSIPLSPLAHVRSTLHMRTSLISRAHGLAYIAFCSSRERSTLLKLALDLKLLEDQVVSSSYQWRRTLRRIRKMGYATRLSRADMFTNSIAVPVKNNSGGVFATIGVTYFRKVANNNQIDAMIQALKDAANGASENLVAGLK